jgi:hypothetical protein
MSGAATLLSNQSDLLMPRIDVYSRSCASAKNSDSVITVNYVSANAKKQVESKLLLEGLVSELQRSQLIPQKSAVPSDESAQEA